MGLLAHQFPGEEIKILKGKWKKENLQHLPETCFFVSDFTKEKSFHFIEDKAIGGFSNNELNFNSNDSVFFASGKAYLNGLQWFIDGFEANKIQKAIYSRIKRLPKNNDDEIEQIFRRLAAAYQEEALVYLISDEKFGTWIGATPEILLSGNTKKMRSIALAGTKHNTESQWTKKEQEEHQFVVDDIKEKIERQAPKDLRVHSTETVKKGKVFHLQTQFEFQLSSEKWNVLMNELHPTPAVCGTPTENAKAYILIQEPHERALYTGLIGWKSQVNIDVYVNLRCMQVLKEDYALYVGGGITKASRIEKELQETEDKSETLISIISNSQS